MPAIALVTAARVVLVTMVRVGQPIEDQAAQRMRVPVVPVTQARGDLNTMVLVAPHMQVPEGQCIAVREGPLMMALVAPLTQVQEVRVIADPAGLATLARAVAGIHARAFVGKMRPSPSSSE
jgi:hypothetical protein